MSSDVPVLGKARHVKDPRCPAAGLNFEIGQL